MKKRILIADDSREICESIAMSLDDRFDFVLAHDGEEALALVLAGGVDLMLLDVMMPGRDGASVLQAMRECGSTVRVVLSSASHDLQAIARQLAVTDVLPKPYDLDQIEAMLNRALARS